MCICMFIADRLRQYMDDMPNRCSCVADPTRNDYNITAARCRDITLPTQHQRNSSMAVSSTGTNADASVYDSDQTILAQLQAIHTTIVKWQ
jgi:hypothetical protein